MTTEAPATTDIMTITTRRLLLVPSYDVIPQHIEWLNDKKLMRWSEQQWRVHNDDTQWNFLNQARMTGNPIVFDIRRNTVEFGGDTNHTVGSLHVYIDRRHHRADMGIMIGPEFHHAGYGREAWKGVEEYLHAKVDGIWKIEAGTPAGNRPMVELLKSLHYVEEGRRVRHWYDANGTPWDMLLFGKVM